MLGGHPEKYFHVFVIATSRKEFTLEDDIPINKPKDNALEEGIYIFTRAGGGNREDYATEIKKLQKHTDYIRDFDDNYDNTYATFVFKIPLEWQQDYAQIKAGKLKETTKKYQDMILATFPLISDKISNTLKMIKAIRLYAR